MTLNVFNLFKRKVDSLKLIRELRLSEKAMTEALYNLDYDAKKTNQRVQSGLDRAVKSHDKGDAVARRDAVLDMKTSKAEGLDIQNERQTILKARSISRITARKLERHAGDKRKNVLATVMKVMNDDRIKQLVNDSTVREDQFTEDLNRMLDNEMARFEDTTRISELDTLAEEELVKQIAEATKNGKPDKVRELTNKITGYAESDSVSNAADAEVEAKA